MRSPPVRPPQPSPSTTPPALPSLWTQLPRDVQQTLAMQLAVLLRRCWTLPDPAPLGGHTDDRD
jgi:hypothetical protein